MAVKVTAKPKKKGGKITNWFLDEKIIDMSVSLSALQILSYSIDEDQHRDTVTRIRNSINFLTNKLLECQSRLEKIALNCGGDNSFDEMVLAALYAEFDANLDQLPNFDYLFQLTSLYSRKEVFIALTERLTEKVSGLQVKLTKFKNISKKKMEEKIAGLSVDFFANESQICNLETKIRAINDFEIEWGEK